MTTSHCRFGLFVHSPNGSYAYLNSGDAQPNTSQYRTDTREELDDLAEATLVVQELGVGVAGHHHALLDLLGRAARVRDLGDAALLPVIGTVDSAALELK